MVVGGGVGGLGGWILATLIEAARQPVAPTPIDFAAEFLSPPPRAVRESIIDWLRSCEPWDYVLIFLLGAIAGPTVDLVFVLRRWWSRVIEPYFRRTRYRSIE